MIKNLNIKNKYKILEAEKVIFKAKKEAIKINFKKILIKQFFY